MSSPTPEFPRWLDPMREAFDAVVAEDLAPKFPHPPAEARPAAVLMLFHEIERDPAILLTERSPSLRHHARQISFPGGRSDDTDPDLVFTALREAHEEVGLDAHEVDVFGELPSLWLPPSNHAVTTVLGWWSQARELRAESPDEVARVLPVRIADLMDPARRFSVVHPSGWIGPAFDIGTDVPLWGFTAGIIARLFEYIGWEQPWDDSRVIDVAEFMDPLA